MCNHNPFRSIRELMSAYAAGGNQDWKKYAFFSSEHYVRNLVEADEDFELMVRP